MFIAIEAVARRFDAEHLHARIIEERVEQPQRIGTAADAGDQQVGQAAGAVEHLRARFLADHALEVAHHLGVGMRAGRGADDVEGVVDIRDPVAQPFVHRVLERRAAAGDRDHFCAEQLHPEHVGRLPRHVLGAHVDHARQAEARADCGGGDPVLARAGLGDDAGLAHPHRQQDLADAIVDLVCAGVIELVALEPHLCSTELFRDARRKIERARAADVMLEQVVEFRLKRRIGLRFPVFALEIEHQRHQRLGDIASAELAEMAAIIGLGTEGIDQGIKVRVHRRAALQKAAILSTFLIPGALSTPEEVSTSGAPVRRIASATLAGVRPPARPQGVGAL